MGEEVDDEHSMKMVPRGWHVGIDPLMRVYEEMVLPRGYPVKMDLMGETWGDLGGI